MPIDVSLKLGPIGDKIVAPVSEIRCLTKVLDSEPFGSESSNARQRILSAKAQLLYFAPEILPGMLEITFKLSDFSMGLPVDMFRTCLIGPLL